MSNSSEIMILQLVCGGSIFIEVTGMFNYFYPCESVRSVKSV